MLKPRLAKLCILIVWWTFPYFEQVNTNEKIYINLVSRHFPADYFFEGGGGEGKGHEGVKKILEKQEPLFSY